VEAASEGGEDSVRVVEPMMMMMRRRRRRMMTTTTTFRKNPGCQNIVATKHPESSSRNRQDTRRSYKMSAERKSSGWFALLHFLHFNSATIFRKRTGDANSVNVPSQVLQYISVP
jgi:hypothetical protein